MTESGVKEPGPGRSGRIAGHLASLTPTEGGLVLRVRRRQWLLNKILLRHVDRDGDIRFTVEREGEVLDEIRYRRRGPTGWDLAMAEIDFTADEPWDWEDRDFGLFVFSVATGTGPIKYRHLLDHPVGRPFPGPLVIDEFGMTKAPAGAVMLQEIDWDEIEEIRVKFSIGSIWAEHSLLVCHGHEGLCTLALDERTEATRIALEYLEKLPGWDDAADAAIDDALDYARAWANADRSLADQDPDNRAERDVWVRPPGRNSPRRSPA